jgi:hypothetical protein
MRATADEARERERIFAARIREFGDSEQSDMPTSVEIPVEAFSPAPKETDNGK